MSYLERMAKNKARHERKRKKERKLSKKMNNKGYVTDAWSDRKEAIKKRVEKREQVSKLHAERRRTEHGQK